MDVIVASTNPVKVRATQGAFEGLFPSSRIEITPYATISGVNAQPRSDEETRNGALNRVTNISQIYKKADFWVGLEGGIHQTGSQWYTFAWVAIKTGSGEQSEARSPSLQLPSTISYLLEQGLELGEACDRAFSIQGNKHKGGAFGLLTRGLHTRESIYVLTLELCLTPILYYSERLLH